MKAIKMPDRERHSVLLTRTRIYGIYRQAMTRWKDEVKSMFSTIGKADYSKELVHLPRNKFGLTDVETAAFIAALSDMAKDGAYEALMGIAAAGAAGVTTSSGRALLETLEAMGASSLINYSPAAALGAVWEVDVLNTVNAVAEMWATQYGGIMIGGINNTTRKEVGNLVAQAIRDGWSNDELANRLELHYTFSEDRAELIARTETAYADVAGNMATYAETGVEKKMWMTGPNSCDECIANGLEGAIDFSDTFSSGDFAPPAHPNCTCDIMPVLED